MLHSGYVKAAQDAIAHVKSAVRYRGLNTAGGWIRHPLEIPQKFDARIWSLQEGGRRNAARSNEAFDVQVFIDEMASLGRLSQTGNCGELSAIAFLYLKSRGIAPIDYFALWRGDWNHAFVVLNRDASIPVQDFGRWSYSAVVCDPLYDRSADAGHLAVWYPKRFPLQRSDVWQRWEG
ncbi:hypothetical protein [Xenophilus sp. Marseille-Q4582]|uniref:hypothetical protein n=1 Tax=Xenophilus sp. Marseille-Q4582 TaxID=2866600 RepID=UPI001CE45EB6|nr:hypothetical protein [Xenophilus sp. Marseille-Q4582]